MSPEIAFVGGMVLGLFLGTIATALAADKAAREARMLRRRLSR